MFSQPYCDCSKDPTGTWRPEAWKASPRRCGPSWSAIFSWPAAGGSERGLFLGVPAAIRPIAPKPERSTEATDQIVVVFLDGHHRSDVESLKESRRLQIRCETTGMRTPVLMTTRARPPSNTLVRTDIFPAKRNRRNWSLSKLRPTRASPVHSPILVQVISLRTYRNSRTRPGRSNTAGTPDTSTSADCDLRP